jgi:hypothetical protein
MAEVTSRSLTSNFATYDYDSSRLIIGTGHSYVDRDYENILGSAETVAMGQVMGRVSTGGKIVPCKSAATDGSEIPVGILMEGLTEIADGTVITGLSLLIGGDVARDKVVFDGTDTFDTVVDGRTMEDWLIANGNNFEFLEVLDDSDFDN